MSRGKRGSDENEVMREIDTGVEQELYHHDKPLVVGDEILVTPGNEKTTNEGRQMIYL